MKNLGVRGYLRRALILLASLGVTFTSVQAQAPFKTQFWFSEIVAAAQVGVAGSGEELFRSIRLAVLAETPVQERMETTSTCIKNAFYGKTGEQPLNFLLSRSLDLAFRDWSQDPKRVPPDLLVLESANLAITYSETLLDSLGISFTSAIAKTQVGLAEVDSAFRDRLVRTAECNSLAKSAHLALVQRLCPKTPFACGVTENLNFGGKVAENAAVARFEMLMAWATVTQGNAPIAPDTQRKSLLKPHVPIVFGVNSRSDEAQAALTAFDNRAGFSPDPYIAEPIEFDRQSSLERLVVGKMTPFKNKSYELPASVLLALDTPLHIGIRLAQIGAVSNAQFAMANSRRNQPDSTYLQMSDEVARRRIVDCVVLQGIPTNSLGRLSECAGYTAPTQEVLARCLNLEAPCRPQIVIEKVAQGAALMSGSFSHFNAIVGANLLPRFKPAGLTFELLADRMNANCGDAVVDQGKLADCMLRKGLGDDSLHRFMNCALDQQKKAPSNGPMTPTDLSNVVRCHQAMNIGDLTVHKTIATLNCLGANAAFQRCIVKAELPAEFAIVEACASAKTAAEQNVCYAEKVGKIPLQQLKSCMNKQDAQSCLGGFMPDGVKKLQAFQKNCARIEAAVDALSCAQAAGLNVDPTVTKLIACTSSGLSAGTALCLADGNIKGPAGDLARCYADSASSGGGSAVAACLAAKALGFNDDLRILAQCAAATGGQPMATGVCTFGQLAMRELGFCKGKKVGEDKCFGENNTLRRALGIGRNHELLKVINIYVDISDGMFAFAQNTTKAATEALRDAGRELTALHTNVYREVGKAGENLRKAATVVVKDGVYVKVDHTGLQIGGTKIELPSAPGLADPRNWVPKKIF